MRTEPNKITVPPGSELDRLLAEAADRPLILEKGGVPLGAIISARDMERLGRLTDQERADLQVLAAMREPFKGVPPEEIEREVARVVGEVRAENRKAKGRPATGGR